MNAREIFRRASALALQTGRGNLPAAEHFPRNMVVSRRRRDRFHPPGESGLATHVVFVIDAIHFDCVQLQSQPRQDRYTRHTHVHC